MQSVELLFENKSKALAFMRWLATDGVDQYLCWMEDDACCSVNEFSFDYYHLRVLTSGQLHHCSEEKE